MDWGEFISRLESLKESTKHLKRYNECKVSSSNKPNNIIRIVADIEANNSTSDAEYNSWVKNDHHNFAIGGWRPLPRGRRHKNKGIKSNYSSSDCYLFVNDLEFTKSLITAVFEFNTKVLEVFFHNLAYDITFILPYLLQICHNRVADHEDRDARRAWHEAEEPYLTTFRFSKRNEKFLFAKLEHFNPRFTLNFRDSLTLLGGLPLASIGELMGLAKQELDYNKRREFKTVEEAKKQDPQLIDYLTRDIAILGTALSDLRYRGLFGNLGETTSSRYAFKLLLQHINQKQDNGFNPRNPRHYDDAKFNVFLHERDENPTWDIAHRGYRGGFTSYDRFRKNKILNNVYYADVKSMYPAVMAGGLPYGGRREVPIADVGSIPFDQLYVKAYVKATLKDDAPTGIWCDRRAEFSKTLRNRNGDIYHPRVLKYGVVVFVFMFEFSYFEQFYNIEEFEIEKAGTFNLQPLMSSYIHELYPQKQSADEMMRLKAGRAQLKGAIKRQIVKLKLNKPYGRIAMNPRVTRRRLVPVTGTPPFGVVPIPGYDGKNMYWEYLSGERAVLKPELRMNILIAGYITAKARCRLYDMMMNNKEGGLYSDTDSVYLNYYNEQFKLKARLGEWQFIKQGDGFKYIGSKTKIACSNDMNDIEVTATGISVKQLHRVYNKRNFCSAQCMLKAFTKVNLTKIYNPTARPLKWGVDIADHQHDVDCCFKCAHIMA